MVMTFDPEDREVTDVTGFWSMTRSCSLDCESGVSERIWMTDASAASDCGLEARRGSKCSSRSLSIYETIRQGIFNIQWKMTGNQLLLLLLLLLQPFYGPLDFVRDYPGEPVPER